MKEFKHVLSWEEKARRNPLYAVMAVEQFADRGPADWSAGDLELLFAKGRAIYSIYLEPILQRLQLDADAFVVEYGSGMGRVLKALHEAGYRCGGIDIAPTMLEHSRRLVREVTTLSGLEAGRSTFPDRVADAVFSYAVLQHIPHLSEVKQALREMCRLLKAGGILRIQTRLFGAPVGSGPKAINLEHWSLLYGRRRRGKLRIPGAKPVRHTNWLGVPLSYRLLVRTLARCGVKIVGVEEDILRRQSFWVLARKFPGSSAPD